jgi:hypothetical protein
LVIESKMYGFSDWWAFFALGTISVPRFGPTVPVAPAAASVWQELQPAEPVKIALPAAALLAALPDVVLVAPPEDCEPLEDGEGCAVPPPAGAPFGIADGGEAPIGGAALACCDCSQDLNLASNADRVQRLHARSHDSRQAADGRGPP